MDHANTLALFGYWNDLRRGRDAPFRSEIDPRRISSALETMFILEVSPAGEVRFRLAGGGLCDLLGLEARGLAAETIMDIDHGPQLVELALRVVSEPGVAVMRVKAAPGHAAAPRGEVLLLPMRSELGRMDRVLGAVNMDEASGKGLRGPVRLQALGARLTPIAPDPEMADSAADLREPAFAEAAAAFVRPAADAPPALKAIEGNPDAPRRASPDPQMRSRLRLVDE